jgi:uncharacterized protein YbjT (DUF2867 family)
VKEKTRILLTGSTGYIGGLLRTQLETLDHLQLRCLIRDGRSAGSPSARTEMAVGDLLQPDTLGPAMVGIDIAYYMVHSMGSSGSFEEKDRRAAHHFGDAARQAGVRRIIYLGGLGGGDNLSAHLRSRQEVGAILASYVPTLELRASIVLGSGSLSFEMIRALVERLPMMVTPKWVEIQAQPIAIDDLLDYLLQSMTVPIGNGRIIEVGGADRCSYGDLMREYGRQRGLSRAMIKVPMLTPHLSGLWLGLVTPLYARVGRSLIESTRHPTVVENPEPGQTLFEVDCKGMKQAIAAALEYEEAQPLADETCPVGEPDHPPIAGIRVRNRLFDDRSILVNVSPSSAFDPIRRIGGSTGWYAWNGLWVLRGWLDRLIGGRGMSRGRRDIEELREGDVVDCWRVEKIESDQCLQLRADMRLPGRAWLRFSVEDVEGRTRIRQTAIFDPRGLSGLVYWILVCPFHALVFRGMLRGIARASSLARI